MEEEGEGEETSAGSSPGGGNEGGREHLGTGGATQMSPSSSECVASADIGPPTEEPSSGTTCGAEEEIVAFREAVTSEGYREGEHRR